MIRHPKGQRIDSVTVLAVNLAELRFLILQSRNENVCVTQCWETTCHLIRLRFCSWEGLRNLGSIVRQELMQSVAQRTSKTSKFCADSSVSDSARFIGI